MTEPNENKTSLPPCMIFVGKEGQWYHEGAEIIHRPIFRWLIQSLEKTEDGLYIVNLNNQRCFLEVEDTPLVVQRVEHFQENPAGTEQVRLFLNDDSVDFLNPETLATSPDNILYCLVKEGQFPARFLRPAYYQMAEFIEEGEGGEFQLLLNQQKYSIRMKEE
jgi:uncharacterized protein